LRKKGKGKAVEGDGDVEMLDGGSPGKVDSA